MYFYATIVYKDRKRIGYNLTAVKRFKCILQYQLCTSMEIGNSLYNNNNNNTNNNNNNKLL